MNTNPIMNEVHEGERHGRKIWYSRDRESLTQFWMDKGITEYPKIYALPSFSRFWVYIPKGMN